MKDLMTKKELADYLNVSTRTVDNYVASGKLTKSKRGRSTVFKKENIERYKEENIIDE